MTTRSEAIDPALLGHDRPIYDKQTVHIQPDQGGQLDVTVSLVLDPRQPAEQAAIDAFAPDGRLDLRYSVELDLGAERDTLASRLEETYRKSEIAATLRLDELVELRNEGTHSREDDLRKAMMPVALLGRSVHRRLFQPETFRNFADTDADTVRSALRSALCRDSLVVMQSPVSLFPWMFLYDDDKLQKDDRTTLELGRFWGFRHQIQDEIKGTSPRVRLAKPPLIVAAISSDLDVNDEHRAGPLGQFAARAPEHVQWIDSALTLRDRLRKFSGDCLYFFGHALQADPPTPTTSVLRLNGYDVSVEEISGAGTPAFEQPLVLAFLNGCETTPLNRWNQDSFAGCLCFRGNHHVCCITTFAEVPDAFARQFAQRFWYHLLEENETVGAALLRARVDLLQQFNNPLGLLYTLLGKIETRIG